MKFLNLIFLLCCLVSCHSSKYANETKEITHYLRNFILSQPIDNETIILINSKGCPACIASGYHSIKESDRLIENCRLIVISKKVFDKVDGEHLSLNPKLHIDQADILEKLNLPVAGFTLIRFKEGVITTIKYFNPAASQQPLAMFFDN